MVSPGGRGFDGREGGFGPWVYETEDTAAPRARSTWALLLGALLVAAVVGGVVRWFTSSAEQAAAAGIVASGVAIQVFRDGYQEVARIAHEAGNFVIAHSNAIVLALLLLWMLLSVMGCMPANAVPWAFSMSASLRSVS